MLFFFCSFVLLSFYCSNRFLYVSVEVVEYILPCRVRVVGVVVARCARLLRVDVECVVVVRRVGAVVDVGTQLAAALRAATCGGSPHVLRAVASCWAGVVCRCWAASWPYVVRQPVVVCGRWAVRTAASCAAGIAWSYPVAVAARSVADWLYVCVHAACWDDRDCCRFVFVEFVIRRICY